MSLLSYPAVAQTAFIRTRVEPEFADAFELAARLDHSTVSDALRRCMRLYIESVAGRENGHGPAEGRAVGESVYANATLGGTTDARLP